MFDRPEVLELLDHLRSEGFVQRVIDDELEFAKFSEDVAVGAADEVESGRMYWLVTDNHPWWHVHR